MFTSIANELAGLVEVAVGIQEPQVSINPFVLFNNGATNVSTNFAAAQAAVRGPPTPSLCVSHAACACPRPREAAQSCHACLPRKAEQHSAWAEKSFLLCGMQDQGVA